MKRVLLFIVTAIIASLWIAQPSQASGFTFQFINPSFGGSYFNGSWMMAQAGAQNPFREKTEPFSFPEKDPLEEFTERLRYAVLNGITNNITQKIFGGESVAGNYDIGDYNINITDDLDMIKLVITDSGTGNTTEIAIPKI